MAVPSPRRRRLERWGVAIGSAVPGIVSVVQLYGRPLGDGRFVSAGQAAANGGITLCYWAATLLVAFRLARRFPLGRSHLLRNAALHLGVAAVRGLASVPLNFVVFRWVLERSMPGRNQLLFFVYNEGMLYLLVLGIIHAVQYYERLRQREVEAVRLQARLAEARLQTLKTQLNPHFLFNALNAVSTLMRRDVDAADRVLARLSELLRMTLMDRDAQEVPLRRELELLDPYLEIERTRFSDRLRVLSRVRPETLDALVPHLLLQPLVENAIRHGIAPRAGPGTVEVAVERVDGTIVLTVQDDGVGLTPGAGGGGTGVGLSNTRDRLRALYGEAHGFTVEPVPAGGTRVTVTIPLRRADGGEAANENRRGTP